MRRLLVALLLFQVCLFAQDDKYAPLPDKIVTAKAVYLMNESGEPKLGDAVYKQIKTWNRWQIVTDKTQADLVLTVSSKTRTLAPGPYRCQERGAVMDQWYVDAGQAMANVELHRQRLGGRHS